MLLYAVLAAALPLALALTCPCPPAPAASEVCGSDLVTYPSQCHLDCAAKPGLSLKHPGPCSATEEMERWRGCKKERKCGEAYCGCGVMFCEFMCRRNCSCGCLGYPRGGMDRGLWEKCTHRRGCWETYKQCERGCGGEDECLKSCWLVHDKCECDCQQQAYPAPRRKHKWKACLERDQCHSSTCSECAGAGPFCAERCKKRCRCACAGHLRPRRDLSREWDECFNGTLTCEQEHSACVEECGDQSWPLKWEDCKSKCFMAREDCSCQCRTAKEAEWWLWGKCKEKYKWKLADCVCGRDDSDCPIMCLRKGYCGCLGYPQGGMDRDLWEECRGRRRCLETYSQCEEGCRGEEECEDSCRMDHDKCDCDCLQLALPAPQRKSNWAACLKRHQCHGSTCAECTGADPFCAERCKKRCRCACAGWPRRDWSGEWEECFSGTQTCEQAHEECAKKCRDQDCRDNCYMAREDCSCECRTAEEEELRPRGECKTQCEYKTCEQCVEGDANCAHICQRSCVCGCLGINVDDASVPRCQIDDGCQTTKNSCLKHCKTLGDIAQHKECEHACILASDKCHCECARSRPPERVKIIQHCNYLS